MDALKSFFPIAWMAEEKNVKSLIISIVVHVVIMVAFGILAPLVTELPLLGVVVGIVGKLIDLYCYAGIVIAVLKFLNVVK